MEPFFVFAIESQITPQVLARFVKEGGYLTSLDVGETVIEVRLNHNLTGVVHRFDFVSTSLAAYWDHQLIRSMIIYTNYAAVSNAHDGSREYNSHEGDTVLKFRSRVDTLCYGDRPVQAIQVGMLVVPGDGDAIPATRLLERIVKYYDGLRGGAYNVGSYLVKLPTDSENS
jgi:hypothetical protein